MASSYRRGNQPGRLSILPYLLALILAVLAVTYVMYIREAIQPSPDASAPPVSATPSAAPSSPAPDETVSGELPWNLELVNQAHPQRPDYIPTTAALPNGKEVDVRIYDALVAMLNDCKSAGLDPIVCSAYRSIDTQRELFDNKVSRLMADGMSYGEAYQAASTEVAVPGTSEHSLGLAVDICALSYQLLDAAQAETAEQKWLMAHSWEYGFILRYPDEKTDVTGIIYEPWHYRYVGTELAKTLYESGLTLEEYLQNLTQ
jgi:D-alanyl-D-alanine carboxypeptidase